MKIEKTRLLFFGCKIDSKLREALAQAKPGERRYFEDPESPFLRICTMEEDRWIGKIVDGGVNVTEVEDIQRNVVSILRRIAPGIRPAASTVKIFSVDPDSAGPPEKAEELVESGGPYIVD
jgi:hypothetical protein